MSEPSPGEDGGAVDRLADRAWAAARWLRWLPDRLLHPARRRRGRRRVSERSPAGPLLFVCHGNICRSPYAEAVFRARARGRVDAASAGLVGPDRPSPETAVEVAGERGVDLSGHRSKLVTDDMLRAAATVVVMDAHQARELRRRHGFAGALLLGDLDPEPIRRRPVRDPIFQPPEVFRAVYARIDRCVTGMLDAMGLPAGDTARAGRGDVRTTGSGGGGGGGAAVADSTRQTETAEG